MTKIFKSMDDLTAYLEKIEKRIAILEEENAQLRASSSGGGNTDANTIVRYLSRRLPQTNLLAPGFLKRAFSVWGHFFVANLIISLILGVAYACLMMLFFGSFLGSIAELQK